MEKKLLILLVLPLLSFSQVNLRVNGGGKFYVSSNGYVVADGNVSTVDAGTVGVLNPGVDGELIMDSRSNAYSSLWISGSYSGAPALYRRHAITYVPGASPGLTNKEFISPPVSGEPFNQFYNRNSTVIPRVGSVALFSSYTTGNSGYNHPAITSTTPLQAGAAYLTGTVGPDDTLDFAGSITTSNVNWSLSSVNPNLSDFFSFNLVGNPYTTYVDVVTLLTDMASNGTSGTVDNDSPVFANEFVAMFYEAKDSPVSNNPWTWDIITIPTAIDIAPGQGFFIARNYNVLPGSASYSVPNTTRLRATPTNADDFVVGRGKSTASADKLIATSFDIAISDDLQNEDSSKVFFIKSDKVGREIDPAYDASELSLPPSLSISTRIAENDYVNKPMAVQSLNASDLTYKGIDLSIPLHINAPSGRTITIGLNNFNVNDDSYNASIYLEDTQEGTLSNLNDGSYSFTTNEKLSGIGRFYL